MVHRMVCNRLGEAVGSLGKMRTDSFCGSAMHEEHSIVRTCCFDLVEGVMNASLTLATPPRDRMKGSARYEGFPPSSGAEFPISASTSSGVIAPETRTRSNPGSSTSSTPVILQTQVVSQLH